MKKILIIIFLNLFLNILLTDLVSADINMVSSSSNFRRITSISHGFDPRILKLETFLEKYNSPLSEYAGVFIEESDNNNIDWRLVAAISGVESTFGKRIPRNSFNAYGWANGEYVFSSWEESIHIVSTTLNEKYYRKGADNINKIARRYAPPSTTWAWKVKYFMNKIEPVPIEFDL